MRRRVLDKNSTPSNPIAYLEIVKVPEEEGFGSKFNPIVTLTHLEIAKLRKDEGLGSKLKSY
jgi:hypothetical protein